MTSGEREKDRCFYYAIIYSNAPVSIPCIYIVIDRAYFSERDSTLISFGKVARKVGPYRVVNGIEGSRLVFLSWLDFIFFSLEFTSLENHQQNIYCSTFPNPFFSDRFSFFFFHANFIQSQVINKCKNCIITARESENRVISRSYCSTCTSRPTIDLSLNKFKLINLHFYAVGTSVKIK